MLSFKERICSSYRYFLLDILFKSFRQNLTISIQMSRIIITDNDNTLNNVQSHPEAMKKQHLTTKKAVEFLLQGTLRYNVCRNCLCVTPMLTEFEQIIEIAGDKACYKIKIKDMFASIYPFERTQNSDLPSKICDQCLDNTIKTYLFLQQCERSERALQNCFEDIYDKFDKLDPLDHPKRGRKKQNPNHNIIYTTHKNVRDYAEPMINLVNNGSALLVKHAELDDGKLECPRCWEIMPNLQSLLKHDALHPSSMWYNCRHCGQSFTKYPMLKRHIKMLHSNYKSKKQADKLFNCTECGAENKQYIAHIQHLERHKFKTVMKHLVKGRMNELCSVCLDKDGNMTDVRDPILLHGSSVMMRKHRVYDLLETTLPAQSKFYKYQELQIPRSAKILKITKKDCTNLQKDCTDLQKDCTNLQKDCTHLDVTFTFSVPIKVIRDMKWNTNVDSDDFRFPMPLRPEESDADSFQSPLTEVAQPKSISKAKPFCKTCWIFKESSCNYCVPHGNSKQLTMIPTKDIESKNDVDCNFCWLFKNTSNCPMCKKQIERNTNKVAEHANVIPEEGQGSVVTVDNRNIRKRTAVTEDVVQSKKAKWLCNICLTTNDGNINACFCCEAKKTTNDDKNEIKHIFNFDNVNKYMNAESDDLLPVPQDITSVQEIQNLDEEITSNAMKGENNLETSIITENNTASDFNNQGNIVFNKNEMPTTSITKSVALENNFIDFQDIRDKGTSIITEITDSNKNLGPDAMEEAMDVACDVVMPASSLMDVETSVLSEPYSVSTPSNPSNFNFKFNDTTPFAFNIGTSASTHKNRKVLKPIRRLPSHK